QRAPHRHHSLVRRDHSLILPGDTAHNITLPTFIMTWPTRHASMTSEQPATPPARGARVPVIPAAPVVGDRPWSSGDLFAVDLEGSGRQDPGGEAILEIALVPIRDGLPDPRDAFTTLINPGRPTRRGQWTFPRPDRSGPLHGTLAG